MILKIELENKEKAITSLNGRVEIITRNMANTQATLDLIQNQLTYDYQYDQKSVHSMERSVAYAAGLIAFILAVNYWK